MQYVQTGMYSQVDKTLFQTRMAMVKLAVRSTMQYTPTL
jgi:hypothetical protein